ncbi:YwqJ-like deaminase [Nocardia amikacinitolerans]|uniref:YwqJ-like deaminase n=1 Tax=Nocardia amikacinitolerans TaxID=756689 RepID=A0A285L831_9NOCA|nr:YwqJ-like deaminase [Nocardia amikacinitolerans]
MPDEFPAVASSLLIDGKILSHTSLIGPGQANLHPAISDFIHSLPPGEQSRFSGRCAEAALVSDQLWRLDAERSDGASTTLDQAIPHFEGAVITSRAIREPDNPNHGQTIPPCEACRKLLRKLGVQIIE